MAGVRRLAWESRRSQDPAHHERRSCYDDQFETIDTNRVIILCTPVRSEPDSRKRCHSVDANTFFLKRWELVSCLGPPWWLFK